MSTTFLVSGLSPPPWVNKSVTGLCCARFVRAPSFLDFIFHSLGHETLQRGSSRGSGYSGNGGEGTFVVYSPHMRPLFVANRGGGSGSHNDLPSNDQVNGGGNGAGRNGEGGFLCEDTASAKYPDSGPELVVTESEDALNLQEFIQESY